jgi:asparagine synthase (glutamine-hydrolysing)
MMLPGHYLKISDNETEVVNYWDLATRYQTTAQHQSKEEIKSEISEKLRNSIALRMRADVPFGAFLSGGIDSSIVVGLMSEVSSHPVSTFSVVFNEQEYSEAEFSNLIASKFGTKHTEIKLSIDDFLKQIPDALNAMDHPSGDGPNTYVVSKVTKESGIKMALSGLGGDELFAGYEVFKRMSGLDKFRWASSFPKGLRNAATGVLTKVKPGISSEKIRAILALDYLDFEYSYPINRLVLLDAQIKKLLTSSSLATNQVHSFLAEAISHGHPGFGLPLLSKVSYAEINTYMQNVLLRDSDQMSMAHALEVRVPFLDHLLAEYVFGIPDNIKYPHTPKQLLTESFEELLPEKVVNRPKMGFTFPWEKWMKEDLRVLCEEKMQTLARRSEFHEGSVLELWQKFLQGKTTWSRVWHLVVLSFWLEKHGIE